MSVDVCEKWAMVYGNTPDEGRDYAEGMQSMRKLGRKMAWMVRSIEAGKQANIDYPERESRVSTNFIR